MPGNLWNENCTKRLMENGGEKNGVYNNWHSISVTGNGLYCCFRDYLEILQKDLKFMALTTTRRSVMKESQCPFLEITRVGFCKGFPIKKMIPLNHLSSGEGVCKTPNYTDCNVYKEVSHSKQEIEEIRGIKIKTDYYYHPGHTWLSLLQDNLVRVGIDDFSQKLIGKIEQLTISPVGSKIDENNVCLLVNSGPRVVRMLTPTGGVIQNINTSVTADPSLINYDPYINGWVLEMKTTDDGIRGLFYGNTARRWMASEIERLIRVFNNEVGETATDGGESITDMFLKLHEPEWQRIIRLFLG